MSKPPKVVIPGLNRGAGIRGGTFVGRLKGHGPAQLLGMIGLRTLGVATQFGVVTSNSQTVSIAHSETISLSTAVSTTLSSAVSVNVGQSTSLSQVSSSLSGAVSSTSSLSTAVSTVISGSISTVTSMVNSLSAAGGGGGGGTFPNRVFATAITTASTTSVIPLDATIPQVSEGAEALTLSITPTSNTTKIRVEVLLNVGVSAAASWIVSAMFINGGANAVEAKAVYMATNGGGAEVVLAYEYVPGATSAQTISVRYGTTTGSGATLTPNSPGGQNLGGVCKSSMTAFEIG